MNEARSAERTPESPGSAWAGEAEAVLDVLPSLVLLIDGAGAVVAENRRAREMLGEGSGEARTRLGVDASAAAKLDAAIAAAREGIVGVCLTLPVRAADGLRQLEWRVARFGAAGGGRVMLTGCDVTERVLEQNMLREVEQQYEGLVASSPVGVFRADASGAYEYVNPSWCTITGLSFVTALRDGWTTAVHPEDRPEVERAWRASVAERAPFRVEFRCLRARGPMVSVLAQAVPVPGASSDPAGFIGTITDVTELRLARERMAEAQRVARVGSWELDLRTGENWWSDEQRRLSGVPLDVVPTQERFLEQVHPADRLAMLGHVQAVLVSGQLEARYRIVRPDGEVLWLHGTARCERGADGMPARLVGTNRDITDEVRAERLRQEHTRLLDRVFDHTRDRLALLDRDFNFVRVSAAYAKAADRPRDSFLGKNHFELYPSDFEADAKEARRTRTTYWREARPFVYPDHPEWGVTYWDIALVPIFDEDGEVELFLLTLMDVTERVRAVAEREAVVDALGAAIKERETLLREIHHRVKNNLQIIISLLQLHSRRGGVPGGRGVLDEIRQRVIAMSLVHERLYQSRDLTRVDFGDYVRVLARELAGTYAPGDRLRVQVEAEALPLPIDQATPAALVVAELLTNALKYAYPEREGEILVSVFRDGGEAEVCVNDQGVGLPVGFETQGGTTFGWELVRALAAQLQGRVEVRPGPGAHICLRFAIADRSGGA